MNSRRGMLVGAIASLAIGAAALATVALIRSPAEATLHTPFHIKCQHHSHNTTRWRDEQVRKLGERRRSVAQRPPDDLDLRTRSLTAGHPTR